MMCFNRKVLGGLAAVAVGILIFAPRLLGAALPLLFLAACPLSMVFMMRGKSGSRGQCQTGGATTGRRQDESIDTAAEIARLRAEIDQLRAQRAADLRAAPPPQSSSS